MFCLTVFDLIGVHDFSFFFQAEDGIRDGHVTGVQTCALPIFVQYADGSGIDNKASDDSIIVRDAETGALEQVSPDAVLNIDEPLDPLDEKMTAAEAIRQQTAQEASDKIDGVVTFNPGDTYTITGDDAQVQDQIVPNEDGIVDNGDGTGHVSDGVNIFQLQKETIQHQADSENLARLAQIEQQQTI